MDGLADATAEWGLDRVVGRWNGVGRPGISMGTVARLDVVPRTSWGRKHDVPRRPPLNPLLPVLRRTFTGSRRWEHDRRAQLRTTGLHGIAPLRVARPGWMARTAGPLRTSGHADVSQRTAGRGRSRICFRAPAFSSGAKHLEAPNARSLRISQSRRHNSRPGRSPREATVAPAVSYAAWQDPGRADRPRRPVSSRRISSLPGPRDARATDAGSAGWCCRGQGRRGRFEPVGRAKSPESWCTGDQRGAALAGLRLGMAGSIFVVVAERCGDPKAVSTNERARGRAWRACVLDRGRGRSIPHGIGAVMRGGVRGDSTRSGRERIHGGSGYWSEDGAISGYSEWEEGKRPGWPLWGPVAGPGKRDRGCPALSLAKRGRSRFPPGRRVSGPKTPLLGNERATKLPWMTVGG